MADQVEGKWVVPNPQIPRTFGILNIVFGILLLLYGAYAITMIFLAPSIQNAMMSGLKEQQAAEKAERDAKIAELKKKEEAAKTKEEKETIAEEREAVEKSADLDVSAVMNDAMSISNNKQYVAFTLGESIAGILLNIAMLVSGIGLLRMSDKARRLALAIAWLKIVRWVVIVGVTLIVIVPITTAATQKMFQQIERQAKAKSGARAAPMPMAALSQFTAIATAVTSVVSALFASIYPALSLWFLTRPAARAAVLAGAKPAGPSLEFEPGEPL